MLERVLDIHMKRFTGFEFTFEKLFVKKIEICALLALKKKKELKKLELLPSLSLKIYSSVAIMARYQK